MLESHTFSSHVEPLCHSAAEMLSEGRRQVADERYQMEAFRQCWKRKGNEERTRSKDVSPENKSQ